MRAQGDHGSDSECAESVSLTGSCSELTAMSSLGVGVAVPSAAVSAVELDGLLNEDEVPLPRSLMLS